MKGRIVWNIETKTPTIIFTVLAITAKRMSCVLFNGIWPEIPVGRQNFLGRKKSASRGGKSGDMMILVIAIRGGCWLFGLFFLFAFMALPMAVCAQVTVFQADFQSSIVQSSTAVTNVNVGTSIGTWTYQTPTNINVFGDATGTQKALCPDGSANGYGLTANLTNSLLLNSNVTVTLLVAIGRFNSPGTNKTFYLTGSDGSGQISFDLLIFANNSQAGGTNGAVYWNQGGTYTNWFGTNYSNASDIRQLSVSSIGYNPASLSRLQIQLQANGYIVSLDKKNDGTFDWVSSLLPYNGNPKTISQISLTGGTLAGDWFDNFLVTGVCVPAQVNLPLYDTRQTVDMMGVDMERSSDFLLKAANPGDVLKWYFQDTGASVCRVRYDKNQELVEGVFNAAFYSNQVVAMKMIQATNPAIKFFGVLRSDYMGFDEGDTNNWPTWIYSPTIPGSHQPQNFNAVKYGSFLADYVTFMATSGVPVAYLDTGKEGTSIVTPQNSQIAIDTMNGILDSNGIARPLIVAPDSWDIPSGIGFLQTTISSNWQDRYYACCSHNYGSSDPTFWSAFTATAQSVNKSAWDSESDSLSGGRSNGVEVPVTNLFSALGLKFESYRRTLNGEIFFEVWSRGIDSASRAVYFQSGQTALRMRAYYLIKEMINTFQGRRRVVESVTGLPTLNVIAFRSSTDVVVWLVNSNSSALSNVPFNVTSGTITGLVNQLTWNDTTTASGSQSQFAPGAPGQFMATLPANSIVRFTFNIALTPLAPDAYYPLEGSALDGSGNGNNGAPSTSATNYILGRVGQFAMQFNGSNSYVQIPRSIGVATNFTIAFWLKTTSVGGNGAQNQWWNGCGLVDGDVSGTANDFGVSLLNGNVAFGVGNPDTTLLSSAAVNDGVWHHVAVTRDGNVGTMTIYLDGQQNTYIYGPTGPRAAPPYLRFGSLQTGSGAKFYNGTLDDVRLYNGLLDPVTIAQLAAAPLPNQPPVLSPITNQTIIAGQILNLTNSAVDPDVPPQLLTWSLQPGIAGLTINTNTGVINWHPTIAQSPTTNALSLIVADNGTPSLSATQQFTVKVLRPANPQLSAPQVSSGSFGLTISGNPGPDYTVMLSSNLANWTALLTTNPAQLPITLHLPLSNNLPQRFYRVQLGP